MSQILIGVGLVLVIEGALYALFPDFMRRVAAHALSMPIDQLRFVGLISAVIGVLFVWLVR